jgi:diguanylate cyclase (GGDEF)-like protein/PAS domain S-box-containing protein
VSNGATAGTRREDVLAGLLRHQEAVVAAVASDGVFVDVPAALGLPAERVLTVSADRATMVDVVVPEDALTVVAAWEQARAHGLAFTTVRTRTDPATPLSLLFLDVRAEHGVYLCSLEPLAGAEATGLPVVAADLQISRRPRTATMRKNMLAVITDVDERLTAMLGWDREQLVGTRSSDFVHPDDQERAIGTWMELLSRRCSQRIRLRHRRADGTWAWVELENEYVPAGDPADAVVVTTVSDVSDEMAAHEAVQQRERLLRRVAESLPVGILQLSADRELVYANSRLPALLGLPALTGVTELTAAVEEADRPALEAALGAALAGGPDAGLEVGVREAATGTRRVCAVSLVALGDREGAPGALLSLTDVTDSVRAREELTARATYDVLTGCHNRASTMAVLARAVRDAATAVVFVDLDRLKPVNDSLGHDAGDELLALTAQRLATVLRREDIVGRIGGDEFLVVCCGLGSPDSALAMGHRVREALTAPAVVAGRAVDVSASIGVAWAQPGSDVAALVKRADEAMYTSKQEGRGRPVLAGR